MSVGDRPRILVLGGGFGGLGAVTKLEDADAPARLVTVRGVGFRWETGDTDA